MGARAGRKSGMGIQGHEARRAGPWRVDGRQNHARSTPTGCQVFSISRVATIKIFRTWRPDTRKSRVAGRHVRRISVFVLGFWTWRPPLLDQIEVAGRHVQMIMMVAKSIISPSRFATIKIFRTSIEIRDHQKSENQKIIRKSRFATIKNTNMVTHAVLKQRGRHA